jgi:class 3 adenylate cyclase
VDGLQTAAPIVIQVTAGNQSPVVMIRQPGRVPLRLVLGDALVEVGRDCPGLVLTDPRISRRHLSLQAMAGTVRVTDLGSRNGTFVNGTRIRESHLLARGERVQLGGSTISLLEGTSPAVEGPSDVPRATSIELVAAAAVADPPDFTALSTEPGTLTIVLSGIEESTRRAAELGTGRWESILEMHNAIVRRHVSRYEGLEIKARGDGFAIGFPSARRALAFAVGVQRALNSLARSRPADTVRVRTGAHAAELVVGDDGDLVGRPIVIASLVANAARGGEILVTGIVRGLLESRGDVQFGAARLVALKGCRQHLVHPVLWAPRPSPSTQQFSDRKGIA